MSLLVLIAEDHTVLRQGLRALLANEPDIKLVGDVEDGQAAVELATQLKPDVVVMDVRMPSLNGLDASRQIKAACPACKIVVLSANLKPDLSAELLNAGVSALVPKESAYEELALAIRTVAGGKMYISPRVADRVVDRLLQDAQRQFQFCLRGSDPALPGAATDRRGPGHQRNRRRPEPQRQNHRNAPAAVDGEAEPVQRGGADEVCGARGAGPP